MMATIPLLDNVARDSVHRIHRITRENRSLWYQLTVLQQPERARACGSGMKANSDRRPVDPPPVVELRIIEGPTAEEGKDITFDYNANFFLYASLEQARTMAHGRVQTPAATNPPILTGVPASGMAYLDRPAEAGYFIFPDLSVRHEGYFRLSFSLFETTKEEKDFDLEPSDPNLPPGVDWRMEIKTQPFNVFSAKKFPGLMESTQLSKTVADQGCRVRIRRDVRMRKRDTKGNGFDRREDEYRRRTATPAADDPNGRSRSQSDSSEQRLAYGVNPHRRTSVVDGYHAPPPPLPGYEDALSPSRNGGHLSFGEQSTTHYATPCHYHHQQPKQVAHQYQQTPAMVYSSHSPYAKPEPSRQVYPNLARHMSIPPQHNASYDRGGSRHVPASPSNYAESTCSRDSYGSSTSSLAPLLPRPTAQSHRPSESSRSPRKSRVDFNPLKIPYLVTPSPRDSPIEPQKIAPPILPPLPTGGKRKHDHVFPPNSDSLHNGQRQYDDYYYHQHGLTAEADQGQYPRADGQIEIVQFNHCQLY